MARATSKQIAKIINAIKDELRRRGKKLSGSEISNLVKKRLRSMKLTNKDKGWTRRAGRVGRVTTDLKHKKRRP